MPHSKTIPRWLAPHREGVVVRFHIQPKASRSELCGEYGAGDDVRMKVRIAAPPVDGAANEELLRFLKKITGIPSSRLHLLRGDASKAKDVLLQGISAEAVLGFFKKP